MHDHVKHLNRYFIYLWEFDRNRHIIHESYLAWNSEVAYFGHRGENFAKASPRTQLNLKCYVDPLAKMVYKDPYV